MKTAVIAAAAAAAVGCGITSFDDRRDQAWSDSKGPPSGVDSSDYGVAIDSVSTELPGATIVALGLEPPTLTTLTYDEFGEANHRGIALAEAPRTPLALAGARDVVTGVTGLVAVALLGGVALFDSRSGLEGPEPRAVITAGDCDAPADDFGEAITIAPTNVGDPEAPDLVILSGSQINVVIDVDPDGGQISCGRCTLFGDDLVAVEAVDLGFGGDRLVVTAVPRNGPARLVVLSAARIADFGDDCLPLFEIAAPDNEPDFGAALATGDFDDDNDTDIVATAPAGGVIYALRDVEDNGFGGAFFDLERINAIGDSEEFGVALELVDLDGDEGDELVVGDPGATADSVAGAGSAYIFSASDDGALDVAGIVFDSTPVAGQRFGRTLTLAEFVAPPEDTDLLVVGASGEVFTYFRALFEGEDPR